MQLSIALRWTTLALGLSYSSAAFPATFETKELNGINFIILSGDINIDDDKKFNRIATVFDEAVVFLDSKGGSTVAAIKIGEAIRLKGYSTYVGDTSICTSACALIWLAGAPRFLDENASVGFHATYRDVDGKKLESGGGNALVGRYLTLLNLSEKAVLFATSAPPEGLNWLTVKNYQSLGVDVSFLNQSDSSSSAPPVVRTVTRKQTAKSANTEVSHWKDIGSWSIRVDHTLNGGCFALSDYGKYAFRIGFDTTDSLETYAILVGADWKSLREGQNYPLALKFDNELPWEGAAQGTKIGDIVGLKMNVEDEKFWTEFAGSKSLSIDYDGTFLVKLNMGNSQQAFDELAECQKQQLLASQSNDPFANKN